MTDKKTDNMFITGANSFQAYAAQTNEEMALDPIPRGHAKTMASSSSRTFENFSTNISVKSDYNRSDYDYFRPSYTVPQLQKEIIGMCMEAYQKVGLIRNVVDLMSDFGAGGIRLQHTIPSTQEFYTSWFEKVQGKQISERFLNLLYRAGQVILKESHGKVSVFDERDMRKGKAQDIKLDKIKPNKREIPLKYTFIDILSVEALGQELIQFVGQPTLALRISPKLKTAISTAVSAGPQLAPEVRKMIEKIPKDISDAILSGKQYIPLDFEKTSVYYYKKDDWMTWANPMCYSILDDLLMLNKLKLADISALDGAISNIRLWSLGIIGDSPANSILPTKSAINKLRSILSNNVGGGVLDLVWGPELKFMESNSQVWRFLGSEKYNTTINAIYEGLGIPAPLRAGAGTSNTGNFIGLNTLIKRLQYGRDRLIEFWTKEIKYVHKAMGFPGKPPQVVFDFMALADEPAEKQLLINLWDRDIISDETILELFGRLPNIEKSRVKREMGERINETMPYKSSPYHNPMVESEYRKILLQGGNVTPSEIGVYLDDRKEGEKTKMELLEESQLKIKKMDIENQQKMNDQNIKIQKQTKQEDRQHQLKMKKVGVPGRPLNIKETQKRKPKPTGRPSTKAEFVDLVLWANAAQETISDLITPSLLHGFEKPNLRSLAKDEFELYEKVKLDILCGLSPFEKVVPEKVQLLLASNQSVNEAIIGSVKTLRAQFVLTNNREPTVAELRQIFSSAYAITH
jgi:hypothetical protein